jgi:D-amino-acid oxidase
VAVTVYARDFPPHTTSDIAGALWSPATLVDKAEVPAGFKFELEEAARIAHKHFMRLSHRSCGVRWLDFYLLTETEVPHESWEWSATPDLFRPTTLGPDEHPFPGGFAHRYRLMMIDPAVYLPALVAEIRAAGGQLETRTVTHLSELPTLGADVVVNCTGLGSRDLFGDETLMPIKGQLALLPPQPDIDYAVKSMTEDLYMFPRTGGIVLGGSHERGEWSLDSNPGQSARILDRHAHLFDRMRPAGS